MAEAAAERAPGAGQGSTPGGEGVKGDARKYSELWNEADAAQKAGDFGETKSLFEIIRARLLRWLATGTPTLAGTGP